MKVIRGFLTGITWLIYVALALMVLYFPIGELLVYVTHEARMSVPKIMSVQDALLPGFVLAVTYAGIQWLRKKLEKESVPRSQADGAE